ncbi:alpha/beta fold hydrolase [Tenggerimyces flavus]|uniref:Alpha/beta fold hydrolase n=1 Tax=Tenggerimyces flavus TaxID=1708749 RepID=A0ABV7YDQ0_9ACTN|nr:alpha/beta hydrolase [Tenggerimyces flavus]MBM7788086.1 pimeloyl-ACP methyl ester carboxylesterase [Tenggerimyces flavus]
MSSLVPVTHHTIDVDGIEIFYRQAGPPDAPVVLLPHGYPSSSFQYRMFMRALGDRYHLIAPDYPGFGYSEAPPRDTFTYSFQAYADGLERFTEVLSIDKYTLYIFDYGSDVGFDLAARHPERIDALIIQNGDLYEDALGPKYQALKELWADPTEDKRAQLRENVTFEGLKEEVLGEVAPDIAQRISPDLWQLSWPILERNREAMVDLFLDLGESIKRYPAYRAALRKLQPPTLIIWGPNDGYMPANSGRAYLQDLPNAEFHLLPDAGHWAIETHLAEIVDLTRDFLGRLHR